MPWTAKLLRIEDHQGFKDFIVELTDGVESIIEQFRTLGEADATTIKKRIHTRIAQLNRLDGLTIPLNETDFAPTPAPVPPVPPDPTAEDLAFEAWSLDRGRLVELDELVRLGVILDTHPKVLEIRDRLRTTFQPQFLIRMGI